MPDLSMGSGAGAGNPLAALFSGLYDLIRGGTGRDMNDANTAAGMIDPLNKYRGGAAEQLNTLISDPSSIYSLPGYQKGLERTMEATNRNLGAQSMGNTGQRALSLADAGERYASNAYNTRFGQLNTVASGSPAGAGAAYLGGRQNQAGQIGGGIGSLFAGVGSGALGQLLGLIGGGGTSGSSAGGGLDLAKLFGGGGGGTGGTESGWPGDFGDLASGDVGGVGGVGGNESGFPGDFADLIGGGNDKTIGLPDWFNWDGGASLPDLGSMDWASLFG